MQKRDESEATLLNMVRNTCSTPHSSPNNDETTESKPIRSVSQLSVTGRKPAVVLGPSTWDGTSSPLELTEHRTMKFSLAAYLH